MAVQDLLKNADEPSHSILAIAGSIGLYLGKASLASGFGAAGSLVIYQSLRQILGGPSCVFLLV